MLQIDWYTDFYYPFVNRWAERVRAVSSPEKMVFLEAIPNEVRFRPICCLTTVNFPLSSSALLHGHQSTNLATWSMRHIGTISMHFS